ncbi:MAG: hypothetical protein V8Q82_06660 [Christensenellales bacterium]
MAQAQLRGLAVGNGHHVYAEGHLQIAVLNRYGSTLSASASFFELDDGAHARAVGLVADVVDAAESRLFFLGQLEDLLQQAALLT